jgi:hypothetical protein
MHMYKHKYMNTYIHAYTYKCISIYINTDMNIDTYIYIYIYIPRRDSIVNNTPPVFNFTVRERVLKVTAKSLLRTPSGSVSKTSIASLDSDQR